MPDDNPILDDEFGGEEENPEVFLDNASDPAQIRRKERRKKLNEDDGLVFWKSVLSNPVGRREMWLILKDAQTFKVKFGVGPNGFPSPEGSWFAQGQQAFGMGLYHKWLFAFPQLVYLMHAENDDRFPRAGARRSKAITSNGRPGPDTDNR